MWEARTELLSRQAEHLVAYFEAPKEEAINLFDRIEKQGVPVIGMLKDKTTEWAEIWNRQVSTIFTDLSRDLADSILGFQSWKDTVLSIFRDFTRSALRIVFEGFFKKLLTMQAGGGGGGFMGSIFGKILGIGLNFIPGLGGLFSAAASSFPALTSGAGKLSSYGFNGGFAGGGIIAEPAIGVTSSGAAFTMAEQGPETVVPGTGMDAKLSQIVSLLSAWQPTTGDALVLQAVGNPAVRRGVGQNILTRPQAGFY